MGLFDYFIDVFISLPEVGCRENDLLQRPSPLAEQYGFCSSFQRGHQQLVSTALEANTDIDFQQVAALDVPG